MEICTELLVFDLLLKKEGSIPFRIDCGNGSEGEEVLLTDHQTRPCRLLPEPCLLDIR